MHYLKFIPLFLVAISILGSTKIKEAENIYTEVTIKCTGSTDVVCAEIGEIEPLIIYGETVEVIIN